VNYRLDPIPRILDRILDLEAGLQDLKMTVNNLLLSQADRISELEAWSDPYAKSGQAICNYHDGMDEDE
jgi:hypothetical protein